MELSITTEFKRGMSLSGLCVKLGFLGEFAAVAGAEDVPVGVCTWLLVKCIGTDNRRGELL